MHNLNDTLYNLPPITRELVKTLDWAWLVDFGQGDFAKAKAMTEIALIGEWNTENLLARALIHQIQGEYNRAIYLLEQAFINEEDLSYKLIIRTIAYLAERKAKENLVDGFSCVSDSTDIDVSWQEAIELLKENIDDLSYCLEINSVQQFVTMIPCWKTTIVEQRDRSLQEEYEALIIQQLTEQLELYQEKSYYAIAEFLYPSLAELLALSGKTIEGWKLLDNLIPTYLNAQKYLEAAWYYFVRGNLLVEKASFGKAIVFGYPLIGYSNQTEIICSLDRSVIDTNAAQQQYWQAKEYFNLANAPRGEAMSTMGLAYVNGIQKRWHLAVCGYEEAQQIFQTSGDYLNAIAAEMGYFWSYLQYEALTSEVIAKIDKSSDWMLNNGTVTFALSWILAFTAAAAESVQEEEGFSVTQKYIKVAEMIAHRAIDFKSIVGDVSCQKLWRKCLSAISDYYRSLTTVLAIKNDWQQAFITSEKIKIYGVYSCCEITDKQDSLTQDLNRIMTVDKVAYFLPPDTVLLSFVVTQNKLLGWVITEKGLAKQHLFNQIELEEFTSNNLEQTIKIWLSNLLESNPNPQLNQKLEQLFLQPFAQEIDKCKHLLIAVCDRLQGFSFSALKYHYNTNSHILKTEVLLGEEKTISYLLFASQIVDCELIASTNNKILIYTENIDSSQRTLQHNPTADFSNLSLCESVAIAISQLYEISYFNDPNKIEQQIIDTSSQKPIIHLLLSQNNALLDRLVQHKLNNELVILNIRDFQARQLPGQQLNRLVTKMMNAGVKSVVVIFDGEDNLATAILTLFFHQGLYFGQSVADSLRQAQRQLRLFTAQEALDFCQYLQSHIPWKTDKDRTLKALIAKYKGDIMVLGKDYRQAAEAYSRAIKILKETSYYIEATSLQERYKMFMSLEKISKSFDADSLIFDAPAYWNNAYIYGDWQLSFV